MIITDKIQKNLEQNSNKIEILKEERNKEIYDSIKKIDSIYEKRINELEKEKNKIMNSIYLDLNDSVDAILYLINKLENNEYKKVVIPIVYKGIHLQKKGEEIINEDYLVVGLSKDIEYLQIREYATYNEQNLNISFTNFLKLAHFNKNIKDNIKVNYLNDTYSKYCNNMSSNINSFISDHRFLYIKDYIRKVIDYRLEKDNYEITLDEMLKLADEFINEYNNSKKLIKDIK